jgi:hypothetical protein
MSLRSLVSIWSFVISWFRITLLIWKLSQEGLNQDTGKRSDQDSVYLVQYLQDVLTFAKKLDSVEYYGSAGRFYS